jgi:archaellum component FlaC
MDLEIILKKLESIEARLEKIENGCSKMTGHIDFIERAYKAVRRPLNFLMDRLVGSPRLPPLIENKKLEENNG